MGVGNSKAGAVFGAGLRRHVEANLGAIWPIGQWHVTCRSESGDIKWRDTIDNLVTTEGANQILLSTLSGAANSTIWYVGLKSTGSYVVADTAASHAGWSELIPYANPRKTWAATSSSVSAGSISNSTSVASFAITSSANVAGAFLISSSSQAATTGVLYAVGEFSAAKDVANGDTLEVTATFTAVTSSGA